jgi:O-antigen/teichoic acid export membrane protein
MGYDYGVVWGVGLVLAVLLLCLVWYYREKRHRDRKMFKSYLKPREGWHRTFPFDR